MPFLMPSNATLGRLKERLTDWMNQQGQGRDWTIEGSDREAIDFSFEYEVIPSIQEVPLKIYLKQIEITLAPSQSWINMSDMLAKNLRLPKGTLFRIFPVIGTVDNQDAEDFSYDIVWEAEKQYWYDIVYDPSKDMRSQARQVLMIDPTGKSDTFVIPHNANAQQVADLWRRVIDAPDDIGISVSTGNGETFHWSYVTTKETISYTFSTPSMRCDVSIYAGKTQFEADQISRLLEIKVPPLVKSHKIPRPHEGPLVQFDEDVVPLGLRIMGTHIFSWNLEGTILRDTQPLDLWVPYDLNLIMRRGHTVNSAIPEDPAEAEFPELPWRDEVIIQVKSHKSP
jgi:hypothetical protein